MENGRAEVVVITGASAGVGRATVRQFAKHGAHIGLMARGTDGLEAARREVEELGGQAIVLSTDVADAKQVEKAAQTVEEKFGPIDIWVNDAMTSVFAPFKEMTPEEFHRVTEVAGNCLWECRPPRQSSATSSFQAPWTITWLTRLFGDSRPRSRATPISTTTCGNPSPVITGPMALPTIRPALPALNSG